MKQPKPTDPFDAILHVVNDYTNLVSSGTLIQQPHTPPINTHVQYSFLVECRKFAAFFTNNRGRTIALQADLASVTQALQVAQHVLEMFRRTLPDSSLSPPILDRLSNRLAKVAAELRKLATA